MIGSSDEQPHPAGRGGLIAAAAALTALPLAAAAGGTYMAGHDGLWLGLGLGLGLVLAGTLLASPAARYDAASASHLISARFGRSAAMIAAVLLCLTLVLSGAGQLASLPPVANALLTSPHFLPDFVPRAMPDFTLPAIIVALALLAVMPASLRIASWLTAAAAAVAVASIAAYAIALTFSAGLAMPIAYGPLLQETGRLELALLAQRLADVATLKAHATPYLTLQPASFFGALAGAACGGAVLALSAWLAFARQPGAARVSPAPTAQAVSARSAGGARAAYAVGLVFLLPVLVLMPPAAVAIKASLYRTIAKPLPATEAPDWMTALAREGHMTVCGRQPGDAAATVAACKTAPGNKGVLRLQDIDVDPGVVWLTGGRIAGLPPLIAVAPAIAAAAAALAALCLALAIARTVIGGATASAGGRTAALLVAASSLALVVLAPADAAAVSWWVLPLASTLLPVLLVGLLWRRATPAGAVAGLVAGAAVTIYYLVAARYFPLGFYDLWQSLSTASLGAERKLVALREAWVTAPDGAPKAAALQALTAHVRTMASWWGVKPFAAAIFGLPAGLLVTVLVSLVTRVRKIDASMPPAVTRP